MKSGEAVALALLVGSAATGAALVMVRRWPWMQVPTIVAGLIATGTFVSRALDVHDQPLPSFGSIAIGIPFFVLLLVGAALGLIGLGVLTSRNVTRGTGYRVWLGVTVWALFAYSILVVPSVWDTFEVCLPPARESGGSCGFR